MYSFMAIKTLVFRTLRKLLSAAGINSVFRYASKGALAPNSIAVRSKFGFWYIGNIFDTGDAAYGILQNGCVEEDEGKVFVALLRALNGSTAYDLGAHTGYYSLLAATEMRNIGIEPNIIAFEPIPSYVKSINESAILNRFEDRIRVFELGISNEQAEKTFYLAGSGSTLDRKVAADPSKSVVIKTDKLDAVIAKNSLSAPLIMKIDIEGHELEAIDGMKSLLDSHKPVLFLEIIRKSGQFENERFFATFEKLISMGYRAHLTEISDKGLRIKPVEDLKKETFRDVDMYAFIRADDSGLLPKANAILPTL